MKDNFIKLELKHGYDNYGRYILVNISHITVVEQCDKWCNIEILGGNSYSVIESFTDIKQAMSLSAGTFFVEN